MDPRSRTAELQDYKQKCTEHAFTGVGQPQDCNQAAQECKAEQDTGVQWRSPCTVPITGVTAINGDPSCGNIWITGVSSRYL
jgi:hypothetical protein